MVAMVARIGVRLARTTPKWLLHAVCDWVHEGVLALIQARNPAGVGNPAGYVYKVACRARERDMQGWQAMAHGVGDAFAAAPPSEAREANAGWADRLRSLGVPMPAMRGRILDLIAAGVRSTAAIAEILGRHHKTIQEHRHALCACLVRFARQQGLELPPELLAEVGEVSDAAAPRKPARTPRPNALYRGGSKPRAIPPPPRFTCHLRLRMTGPTKNDVATHGRLDEPVTNRVSLACGAARVCGAGKDDTGASPDLSAIGRLVLRRRFRGSARGRSSAVLPESKTPSRFLGAHGSGSGQRSGLGNWKVMWMPGRPARFGTESHGPGFRAGRSSMHHHRVGRSRPTDG